MSNSKKARDTIDEARSKAEANGAIDKGKGHAKEAIGTAKSTLGHLIGNPKLEAKGDAQQAEGRKDRLKGEIKETLHDAKDKLKAGVAIVKDKIDDVRGR